MKPTPLTDAEIAAAWEGHTVPVFGKTGINPIVFARAIEAARDAQWEKMLGDEVRFIRPEGNNNLWLIHGQEVLMSAHPAPDHTAVLRQALEALELCNFALYEEKAAWDIDPPIAHITDGIDVSNMAITALKEALK